MKGSALLFSLLCTATFLHVCFGIGVQFEYDDQAAWPPICNVNNTGRQSPIDIITANVVENSSLSALDFSSNWDQAMSDGSFANIGHSVQLTLADDSPTITTQMPVGNYELKQMHFHWGNMTGMGSEHRINGEQFELEIHFVHAAMGTADAGSANAVIGVFADVSNDPISGVWATLNVSQLVNESDSIAITDFTMSSLLPDSKDYYHYAGSLTTPPCNESVQWFVLKNRITVPAAYLENLRMIRGRNGEALTYNFRMVQELNGRVVYTPGSGAVMTTSSLLSILSVAILVIASFK